MKRLNPSEVGRLRDLTRDLEGDGYVVESVYSHGGRETAVVSARVSDPTSALVGAARRVLREVERVELNEDREFVLSAEEFETIQALRSTVYTISRLVRISPVPTTLGGMAHVDFAVAAQRTLERECK